MLMVKLLTLTILPKILHKQKFGQRGVKILNLILHTAQQHVRLHKSEIDKFKIYKPCKLLHFTIVLFPM